MPKPDNLTRLERRCSVKARRLARKWRTGALTLSVKVVSVSSVRYVMVSLLFVAPALKGEAPGPIAVLSYLPVLVCLSLACLVGVVCN